MEELELTWQQELYTVRVWHDRNTLYVRAFHQGRPINPFTYQVALETDSEWVEQHEFPGKELLIEQATADIHEGRMYGMSL